MAHRYNGPGFWGEGLTELTTRTHPITGKTVKVPVWRGLLRTVPGKLTEPMGWRKPSLVFANSMSDLFHHGVPEDYRKAILAVIAACPQHTFQCLTKRAEHMRDVMQALTQEVEDHFTLDFLFGVAYRLTLGRAIESHRKRLLAAKTPTLNAADSWPLEHLWLGVSVEDRERKSRIDALRETPAAVRFISFEPLLEDLGNLDLTGIGWAILGGESGSRARPMDLAWARKIVAQCREQGVQVFVKQLGRRWSDEALSKDLKGGNMRDWPKDLRVREMPDRRGAPDALAGEAAEGHGG
jgi:protein gp37